LEPLPVALTSRLLGVPSGEDDIRPLEPLLGNEQELGANALIAGVLRHFKAFRSGETVLLFLLFGHWDAPPQVTESRLPDNSKIIRLFLKKIQAEQGVAAAQQQYFCTVRQTKTPARGRRRTALE
jgi:hypothetical protein